MKSEEIRVLRKKLLAEQRSSVVVDRLEYAGLLHEVLVLRHKLRRRSGERGAKPEKTE